jgi:hypothetical protein
MKGKFASALSLALILAMLFTTVGLADYVVNNIDNTIDTALETRTIAPGGSTTVGFYIQPNNSDPNDVNGCNATGSTPVTVTLNVPGAVTASATSLVFTGCSTVQNVIFSSSTSGTYSVSVANVSGGKSGSAWQTTEASFSLIVTAPSDTTPPVINYTLSPASPDGNNGWYKSNVSLTWSVSDPDSAFTKTGCVNQNISADQADTPYSCSATSAGGSAGPITVSIKRDATAPGITFSGTISDGSSFVYGSVPAAPTCSASDAGSGPDSCMVTGYGAATGTYTLTATAYDKAGNFSTQTLSYSVGKATSSVAVSCSANVPYTGSAIEPCTATATGVGGLNQSLTVSYTNNFNAGTATASASFAGDDNHEASSNSANFTIDKAASEVTLTCPTNVPYTGSAIEPCTAAVTGAGGLNQSLLVSYTDNTNAGTATAGASFAGDDNHEASSNSANFTIDKAPSVVSVTCPTNVTYTGSVLTPCTAAVTGGGGLNQSLLVSYTDNTNAGTATASASFVGDDNHLGNSGTATFTIDKAPSAATVTCGVGPFTYTGSAFEPCSAAVTGAGGLNQSLTVSYTNNVNAGTATASASFAGDANHEASSNSANFTIDKAPSVTTVTCGAGPFTYTGSALTPCSAAVTGAGGLNQSLLVSYTDNTNAGTATASASFAGDDNHLGNSGTATFTIDKALSTTTVTCPASVTYDGNAQTPCSATVTGAGELSSPLTVSYTDNTNAGTATASASFAGDDNHEASSNSANFTIDKAPSVVSMTCPTNVTYTGSALTPCSAAVTGAGGLNQSLLVSYTDNTNAGTATASASFAGDDNHLGNSGTATFTIDKAPSVVSVTCPASVYFTGSPITPCSATVTGAGGLNQSLTVNYSNNIAVGTATANANYAGDGNHKANSGSATFAILAWTLKGFYQPVDMNGVLNTVKNGSTVPLKFEIFAGDTELTLTGSVKSLTYTAMTCSSLPTDDIELTATGQTVLRYDTTSGQFIFNWKTPSTANACYKVTMTAQDGSTLSANFKLK